MLIGLDLSKCCFYLRVFLLTPSQLELLKIIITISENFVSFLFLNSNMDSVATKQMKFGKYLSFCVTLGRNKYKSEFWNNFFSGEVENKEMGRGPDLINNSNGFPGSSFLPVIYVRDIKCDSLDLKLSFTNILGMLMLQNFCLLEVCWKPFICEWKLNQICMGRLCQDMVVKAQGDKN